MQVEESIQALSAALNLANVQLSASKYCRQSKIELMVGQCADGEGAPEGETAVRFKPTENMEKLVLVGGTIKNYDTVTESKDVYFVMVNFDNCNKLPAKSRMLNCTTSA